MLLRVIVKHLAKFENDSTPMSKVYKTFPDLPLEFAAYKLTARELKTVGDIITERINLSLVMLPDSRTCGIPVSVERAWMRRREHPWSSSCGGAGGLATITLASLSSNWLVIMAT